MFVEYHEHKSFTKEEAGFIIGNAMSVSVSRVTQIIPPRCVLMDSWTSSERPGNATKDPLVHELHKVKVT